MNKSAIITAFNRATTTYDKHASFQRQVGYDLIGFASAHVQSSAKSLLDAGCGTGYFSQYWQKQGYQVTALDFADKMLLHAKEHSSAHHYIQADLEQLFMLPDSFDITFSNLAIQWCNQFDIAISQLYQKTKQTLLFSTIVDDSLYELNHCRQIQDKTQSGNSFLDHKNLLQICKQYALDWQIKTYQLRFPSLMALLFSLKGVGATYQYRSAKKGLTSPNHFKQLDEIYHEQYGELKLTYHVFQGVINCG